MLSAQYLCDKHVPKMLLETTQMLSTAYQKNVGECEDLYKIAYPHHPMTKWVGESVENFRWTLDLADWIGEEFTLRYSLGYPKIHKSSHITNRFIKHIDWLDKFPDKEFTDPPQCMPDRFRDKDYVTAYREFYVHEKKYFAEWKKGRKKPEWFYKVGN